MPTYHLHLEHEIMQPDHLPWNPVRRVLSGKHETTFIHPTNTNKMNITSNTRHSKKYSEFRIRPSLLEQASDNLQNYIDFHLTQMKWAFFCTLVSMIAGLLIVILGIVGVYKFHVNLNIVTVTSAATLLVEFIGATFFVIYRITVVEVQKCQFMLQKMIAVSSVTDMLNNKTTMSDQAKFELAKNIFDIYTSN